MPGLGKYKQKKKGERGYTQNGNKKGNTKGNTKGNKKPMY